MQTTVAVVNLVTTVRVNLLTCWQDEVFSVESSIHPDKSASDAPEEMEVWG